MNANRQNPSVKVSPKTISVILLAALIVVLSGIYLFRFVFSGNVLCSIESGDFRFDLCGAGKLSSIVIYKNNEKTATVKTTSAGNASDNYGVTIPDLNFDGYPDLSVTQKHDGDDHIVSCWLWNASTKTYRREPALDLVRNLTTREDLLSAVSHYEIRRNVREDEEAKIYEDAEIYSLYRTVNGKMVEFARYEFVYYSKNDIHVYSVYRFDGETGTLHHFSEDEWLTKAEASGFSLIEHVEADLAAHHFDYVPAADATE